MAIKVILVCEDCLNRNYITTVNKFSTKRLELKKYCKHCNTYTIHKQTR